MKRPYRPIVGRLALAIRSRAAAGEPAGSIARALDLDAGHVGRYLARRSLARPGRAGRLPGREGLDPSRPIHGVLRRLVRRLHADGRTPDAIAEALNLEPSAIEAFLDPPPPPPPPRPPEPPRPAMHWGGWRVAPRAAGATGAPADDPPGARVEPAIAAAAPAGGPGWDHFQSAFPGRPGALDVERLGRLRALRSSGRTLAECALALGVSIATIKRALRPGYRPRDGP